eukprot:2140198-Rhodomonas_salina.3
MYRAARPPNSMLRLLCSRIARLEGDLQLGCLRTFDILRLAKLPNPTVKALSTGGTASDKKSVTQLTVT